MMMTSSNLERASTVQKSQADAIKRLNCRPPAASAEPLFVLNADNERFNRLELIVGIHGRHDLTRHAVRFVSAGGDRTGRGSRKVSTCAELIHLHNGLLTLRLIQRRYVGVDMREIIDLAELSFRIPTVLMKFYQHDCSELRDPGRFPPERSLIGIEDKAFLTSEPADMLTEAINLAHECVVYVPEVPIFLSGIHYREEVWRLQPKPQPLISPAFC